MQVPNEHEQHRLLSIIESMLKDGRSEHEIIETMNQIGGQSGSPGPTAGHTAVRPGWRLSQARESGHASDAARDDN